MSDLTKDSVDSPMQEVATQIVSTLHDAGYEAYFAGGCVRDLLRGVAPKDYDIVSSATPEEILRIYPRSGVVGAHFGVVLVRYRGFSFEIATFREDGTYHDGRRPDSVSFSSAKEDAKRRDFTINGLFYDPITKTIIDYVDGQADLKFGLLRAIGNPSERFGEDFLRLLRAIRFATVLDFQIETATWLALCAAVPHIRSISPERIQSELDRIWISPHRLRGFDLLTESGLMAILLPEVMALQGCEQAPEFHPEGDVFVHTRAMISLLPADAGLTLVLSVLFHDIAKPATSYFDVEKARICSPAHERVGAEMTRKILQRFRYPNAVIDTVSEAVEHHMRFKDAQKMRLSTLRRFMARPHFAEELELHRVDCLSSHRKLGNHEFILNKQREFPETTRPLLPDWFLRGEDLIALGWKSGPALGRVLRMAHDLQLDGTHESREIALQWLEQQMNEKSITEQD